MKDSTFYISLGLLAAIAVCIIYSKKQKEQVTTWNISTESPDSNQVENSNVSTRTSSTATATTKNLDARLKADTKLIASEAKIMADTKRVVTAVELIDSVTSRDQLPSQDTTRRFI